MKGNFIPVVKYTQAEINAGSANNLPAGAFILNTTSNEIYKGNPSGAPQQVQTSGNQPLNKFDATAAPTTSNNFAAGYAVGSRWIDVTNDESYICTGDGEWSRTSVSTIQEIAGLQTALDNKVDKVTGKQLSTEDYSTTEKTKLSGIASGAEVNVQADWGQATNTADDYIKNKPTSMTPTSHTHAQADVTNLSTDLAAKQATLVNQTNIKSINNISLLGSGDLAVSAPGVKSTDAIAHLENFTANTNGSYTVSASSEFSSGYQAHEAFDSDAVSDWATQGVTSNFWIKIQLPTARAIHRFVAKGRGSAEHMTNWRFEGSNDNTGWTTLDSAAITIDRTTGVDRTFTNTTKYLYYRLFAVSGSGTNPGLSELRLFGKEYSFDNFVV